MTQQVEAELIKDWAPIEGVWQQEAETITFAEIGKPSESAMASTPRGVALSRVKFANGKIKTEITLPPEPTGNYGLILIGFSSWASRCILIGLSGNGPAYALLEHIPGSALRNISIAGAAANLRGDRPYNLEVGLDGQRLTLLVEGIKVLDHVLDAPVSPEQVGLYAQGPGPIKFSQVKVSTEAYSAFVVMQFTDRFNQLFEEVIPPVCHGLGIKAYRASDISRPGVILQDILQGPDESNVVISEVTPKNPNVFYELGYSHALKKPVILLAERDTPLPFDISGYRVIFYDNTIGGKSTAETDLRRHLTSILGE